MALVSGMQTNLQILDVSIVSKAENMRLLFLFPVFAHTVFAIEQMVEVIRSRKRFTTFHTSLQFRTRSRVHVRLLEAQFSLEKYRYLEISKCFPKFGPDLPFIVHFPVENHTLSETLAVSVFNLQPAKRAFPFLNFIRVRQS